MVGLFGMALNFTALAFLPLPEVMAIGYAAPLIIVALAALILGETVRLFRWAAVVDRLQSASSSSCGRASPCSGGDALDNAALIGAMLALVSAVSSAFAAIFVRSMTLTESTGAIVIYFTLTSSAAVAPVAALRVGRSQRRPTPFCSSSRVCSAGSARS